MNATNEATPSLHACINGDVLTMTFTCDFDSHMQKTDWAVNHVVQYPGPFREVYIDISAQPHLTSHFYAGLVLLHFTYANNGTSPMILVNVNPATRDDLHILRLDHLFAFADAMPTDLAITRPSPDR